MTSDANDDDIRKYFADNNNFCLGKDSIRFLKQDSLPAIFANSGKFIANDKNEVFSAPNGNGGLFKGMKDYGIVD